MRTFPKPAEEVIDANYNRNSMDGERYKQIPSLYLVGGRNNRKYIRNIYQGKYSRQFGRIEQAIERLIESPRTGG